MPYFYGDGLSILLVLLSLAVTLSSSIYIQYNYKKYSAVKSNKGLTGYDVARKILDSNNLKDVLVVETSGNLTDHYDPRRKVIKLSSSIYKEDSISAVSVASHECGHAIQDKEGYSFLKLRNKIVPFVNLSSMLGYAAIMIGLVFTLIDLLWIGIIFELVILIFQLITLPVEFNASKRAIMQLKELNIINNDEIEYSKKVLISAALTYVASVFSALIQIFRLILLAGSRDDR